MSEFGNFLSDQVQSQHTTGGEMAASMGISRTHFSAFLTGRRKSCNVETLMRMVEGISKEPHIQAGLLEAYFRDQCVADYKKWITVEPAPGAGEEAGAGAVREDEPNTGYGKADPLNELFRLLKRLALPDKVTEALAAIAEASAKHHRFKFVIQDLGKFAREDLLTDGKKPDTKEPPDDEEGSPPSKPEQRSVRYQETPVRTVSLGKPRGSLTPAPVPARKPKRAGAKRRGPGGPA